MLPTWRPDKAMAVEVPADFRSYVEKLAEVSSVTISNFDDMIAALRKRHDFFAEQGCRLSDHGIEEFYAEDYTDAEIKAIFNKVYGGTELTKEEILNSNQPCLLSSVKWTGKKDGLNSSTTALSVITTPRCSNYWALTPASTLSVNLPQPKQWLNSLID